MTHIMEQFQKGFKMKVVRAHACVCVVCTVLVNVVVVGHYEDVDYVMFPVHIDNWY